VTRHHRLFALLAGLLVSSAATAQTPAEHFENKVRPLLLARCVSCHGAEKRKGGLRLDAAGIARGGDRGPAVVPGKPDESLLILAVRQSGALKMPPNGKLNGHEIADLEAWVKAGPVWPDAPAAAAAGAAIRLRSLEPNAAPLRKHLQAWYRADRLPLADGKPVHVWPDASGKGRDLAATSGVRTGGVGQPGRFVKSGTVNGRPAVRFDPETGLATSPDTPVEIRGDAAFTLCLVLNLQPTNVPFPHDGILGIGDPANPTGNPGKPLAALVQITRTPEPELQLAGGWNHDASLGKASFAPLWDRPVLLTIVKRPGPMRTSTRFFIDGVPSEEGPLRRKVEGVEGVPDIRHRDDIGLYLGKALAWCGSIRGDVSEVIVYNAALSDEDRSAVEAALTERYGIITPAVLAQSKASFTAAQKAFWAFQPVKPVRPPPVRDERWVKSPVDRFILARLEAAGLTPSPPADRPTFIRRVTFDLTGLPPTPAEIDAFVGDDRPDAFERVVDRLLGSPHYGERWGRHWLDVVRFAETTANDANAVMRYAWRYRDYVVRSFNADEPYDRFVIEQLAGDLLPPGGDPRRDADAVIATGFLMLGPKALAETDKEQSRRDVIDDQLDTTGRAFLGLTLGCARCHDHKFDPIPAVDYYSLAGIFRGTEVFLDENRNATMWQEWPLQLPGQPPLVVMAPKESRPTDLRVALRGNYQTPGVLAPRRVLQIIAGEGHAPIATVQSGRLELARWVGSRDNPLTARVLVNRVWQHHFGTGLVATSDNFGARGERPSHPELLDWLAGEFVANGWSVKKLHRLILLSSAYQTSTRGDEGARQADPGNRLLGRTTRRRLDAESLRDALLAVSGRLDRAVGGADSGELLFREAENIGARIRPNRVQADHPVYTTSTRRSLYLPVVRNAVPDVLALFDGADPNGVTAVRNDTTVASQALFLLNHPFVREQSLHFARLLLTDPKATDADRIALAHRLALAREPLASEAAEVARFLDAYQTRARAKGRTPDEARLGAWQSFCQTLFCRNEFLYVD
jgi:mono/diheme cytochrome c family protein